MNNLNPAKLLIFSLIIWIACSIITPYNYFFDDSSLRAIIFLSFSFLAFLIGCKTNVYNNSAFETVQSLKHINFLFYFSLVIGFFGFLFKLYNRIFIERVLIYDSFTDFRFGAAEAYYENTIIDVISGIMYPFGIVALLLYIYYGKSININKYIVWLIGITYPIEGILLGGRLNIIFFATMLFFAFQVKNFLINGSLLKLSIAKILPIIVCLIFFLIYSSNIISTRLDYMGFDFINYLSYLELQRNVEIDDGYILFLTRNNFSNFAFITFAFAEIIHYFQVGIIEFIKLYNFNNGDYDYWMGVHQFSIYLKFFSIIGFENIPSYLDTLSSFHQPGQYTSFIGSALIDFGEYTPIYMFTLGVFSNKIYNSALNRGFVGIMIFPFVATVVIYSPMINFLMNQTLYILTALIIIVIMSKVKIK